MWNSNKVGHLPPDNFDASTKTLRPTRPPSKRSLKKTEEKVLILRMAVCFSLMVACILCGYFGYTLIDDSQTKLFNEQYESIVEKMYNSVSKTIYTDALTATTLATVIGLQCSDPAQWPYCSMSIAPYQDLVDSLLGVSGSSSMSVATIVKPSELSSFESYYQDVIANDPNFPDGAGISDFGFGVYSLDGNGVRYHDTTGESNCSSYNVIAPLILTSNISSTYRSILRNLHSYCDRVSTIDSIISCYHNKVYSNCSHVITDFLQFSRDLHLEPAASIISPITPAYNQTNLVGFVTVSFRWKFILQDIVPSFVNGIDCVITSDQPKSFTYSIIHGVVTLHGGEGDFHDRQFSHKKRTFAITPDGIGSTTSYTISFYPTREFKQLYANDAPVIVSVGAIAIILFTSIIFLLYDFSVKQEVIEKQLVLDSKRIFVRFISHEIRTPMNVLCLGLKLLEDELKVLDIKPNCQPKFDECISLIQELHESSDTAVVVLNDLINYDKIEMKTMMIEKQPLLIWNLVQRTVKPLVVQAKHADINLTVDLEITSITISAARQQQMNHLIVLGDDIKIGQVIRNIVSNAIKFSSPHSEVIITAKWLDDEAPNKKFEVPPGYHHNGFILIKVKDFGPGLSVENQKELFKEGMQFNPNELQAGQGSGLGLWISKGIVEQHNGTISVFSEGPGLGSTFSIKLPVIERLVELSEQKSVQVTTKKIRPVDEASHAISKEILRRQNTAPQAQPHEPSQQLPTMQEAIKRILVVDDVPSNRKILCRLLKNAGYICDEAENGQICIDKYLAASTTLEAYDMILMDYEMPVMNGPTATKLLREQHGCVLPIFGVTGNVLPDDIRFFTEQGADHVLSKPISLSILHETYQLYRTNKSIENSFKELNDTKV